MNLKQNIQSYGRFKNLPWFDKMSQSTVFVGGAGGIGSWLGLLLARTGANVIVVDMDTVEEHNIAGQVYGVAHIGKPKVDALECVIEYLCGENNLSSINMEVTPDGQWEGMVSSSDAVCVGFDNLKARKLVFDHWLKHGKEDSIFVDGRLAAESGQIFRLTKNSTEEAIKAYQQTYFTDEERVELPCTMKATSHCGALIASLMVAQISNHMNNFNPDVLPRITSNVEFHLPLMLFDL